MYSYGAVVLSNRKRDKFQKLCLCKKKSLKTKPEEISPIMAKLEMAKHSAIWMPSSNFYLIAFKIKSVTFA